MKKRSPACPDQWLHRFDAHSLIIAATRYYIGRMTIAACCFANELADAWPFLPVHARSIIRRDLSEAFERDDASRAANDSFKPLGMDCDREAWEKVRKAWQAADQSTNQSTTQLGT